MILKFVISCCLLIIHRPSEMIHPPKFGEAELLTLVDRLVRTVPGTNGGSAKIRQVTQRQERYRGGYDAVVTSVLPFYVQAKAADFHPYRANSDIIDDRRQMNLDCHPGAYAFYLRKHRGTSEPLQHNALYWLSLRSAAAYVCPAFISERSLDESIDRALRTSRKEVWSYQDVEYYELDRGRLTEIRARHFRGLVTIVPHRLVKDYLHRYSYHSPASPGVVFHSDPEPADEAEQFGYFIDRLLSMIQSEERPFINGGEQVSSPRKLREKQISWVEQALDENEDGFNLTAADISSALFHARLADVRFSRASGAVSFIKGLDWMDVAAFFGGLLNEKYGIRQNIIFEIAK